MCWKPIISDEVNAPLHGRSLSLTLVACGCEEIVAEIGVSFLLANKGGSGVLWGVKLSSAECICYNCLAVSGGDAGVFWCFIPTKQCTPCGSIACDLDGEMSSASVVYRP